MHVSCHDSSHDADDIASEVRTVTRKWAVTDELTATRVSVRSREYKMETEVYVLFLVYVLLHVARTSGLSRSSLQAL